MPPTTTTSQNFPTSYSHLSTTEISLLAPIFTPPPPAANTSASSSYNTTTRSLISALPSHLQSKHPRLNTFCSALHSRLNPLPVISLLACVEDEVCEEAVRSWEGMLSKEEMGLLGGLRERMGTGRCAACKLARLGSDIRALIVLGACVIARLGHKKWRKSRRLKWMEAWTRECVEWRAQGDGAVREMWNLGLKLRRMRRGDKFSDGSSNAERERRREMDVPVRPKRIREQEDHVEVANAMLQQAGRAFPAEANPFADDADPQVVMSWLFRSNGAERPEREGIPDGLGLGNAANPFSDEADPDLVMEHLFRNIPVAAEQSLPHGFSHASMIPEPLASQSTGRPETVTSSVYSQRPDGYQTLISERRSSNGTVRLTAGPSIHPRTCRQGGNEQSWLTTEGEIFDLYRQSGTSGGQRQMRDFL